MLSAVTKGKYREVIFLKGEGKRSNLQRDWRRRDSSRLLLLLVWHWQDEVLTKKQKNTEAGFLSDWEGPSLASTNNLICKKNSVRGTPPRLKTEEKKFIGYLFTCSPQVELTSIVWELNGCYWCDLLERIQPPEGSHWYQWIYDCYTKTKEHNLFWWPNI